MTRDDKIEAVKKLRARLEGASLAVLTEYRGLTAGQLDDLRKAIRGAQGEYRVAKNTLTRLAVAETSFRDLGGRLDGPTAIAFGTEDPVIVAKVIVRYADDHDALTIKGGVFEGQYLNAKEVKALAELPSLEQSLACLLAVLQAPATQLLRTLKEPAARLARLVDAAREQKEST